MGNVKIDNYIYICKKSSEADQKNIANYDKVMQELKANK